MSVIVTLEAELKEGAREDLVTMLREFLPETRLYKGFIDISINFQKENNTVLFFEEWESVEVYEAYLAWRGETGVMDRLSSVFTSAPTIRYFDREDV
jgi:quinol monooxygenase YgiN